MLPYQQSLASWYSSEKPAWTPFLKNFWWKGRQFAEEILGLVESGIFIPPTLLSFDQLSTEKWSRLQPFWSHSNIMVLLRANLPQVVLSHWEHEYWLLPIPRQHFWLEYQIHVLKGLVFKITPWVLKIYILEIFSQLSTYVTLPNYEIKIPGIYSNKAVAKIKQILLDWHVWLWLFSDLYEDAQKSLLFEQVCTNTSSGRALSGLCCHCTSVISIYRIRHKVFFWIDFKIEK